MECNVLVAHQLEGGCVGRKLVETAEFLHVLSHPRSENTVVIQCNVCQFVANDEGESLRIARGKTAMNEIVRQKNGILFSIPYSGGVEDFGFDNVNVNFLAQPQAFLERLHTTMDLGELRIANSNTRPVHQSSRLFVEVP